MANDPFTKILNLSKHQFSNIAESTQAIHFTGTYANHAGQKVKIETVFDNHDRVGKLLIKQGNDIVVNVDYTVNGPSINSFRFRKGNVEDLLNIVLSLAVDGGMV